MARNYEFARKATLTDPAVPATIGLTYTYPDMRKYVRRRRSVLRLNAGTITGAGASLTFQLEEELAGVYTALGNPIVITGSNTSNQEVVSVSPHATGLRLRNTAKAGTTPTLDGIDANLVSP